MHVMLLHCEPTCRLSSSLRGCSSLHTASWRLTGRASASRCMTWATARTTSTDVSQTLDSQEAMPNVFWEQSTVWLSNNTESSPRGNHLVSVARFSVGQILAKSNLFAACPWPRNHSLTFNHANRSTVVLSNNHLGWLEEQLTNQMLLRRRD